MNFVAQIKLGWIQRIPWAVSMTQLLKVKLKLESVGFSLVITRPGVRIPLNNSRPSAAWKTICFHFKQNFMRFWKIYAHFTGIEDHTIK